MTNRDKLKLALSGLSNKNSGLGEAFKSVEAEMTRVAEKLRQEAETKTIEDAKKRFREIKDLINSLYDTFANLKVELIKNEKDLSETLTLKLDSLRNATSEFRTASTERIKTLSGEIGQLKGEIKDLSERKVKIPDFASQIDDLEYNLRKEIANLQISNIQEDEKQTKNFQDKLDVFEKEIKELRKRTLSNFSHGGQANRNILVASNPSTLSRYTDLNIKPGANVTLTYVNNDNLKTTDLTIAATGGGGGTSRNISTVTVSSVVADTASTDIVIIASAGIQLTMPTATSNTNLYTIKNTSTSSVMVVANGAETIDGSANIIMPVQYTSIDLISDNSNWNLT